MDYQLVYIVSDARSGSTLLDILLSKNPKIASVGELHWSHQYFNGNYFKDKINKNLCSCGKVVTECDFWEKVENELNKGDESLKSLESLTIFPASRFKRFWMCLNLFFFPNSKNIFEKEKNEKVIHNSIKIHKAVAKVANTPIILESSKESERAKYFDYKLKDNVKFIFLYRDGRGVAYSKMKRGISLFVASMSWVNFTLRQLIIERSISKEKRIFISYDELCLNPKTVLEKIQRFIGIDGDFQEQKHFIHNLGGSPYRFSQKEIRIARDDKWRSELKPFERIWLNILTFIPNFLIK